MRLVHELHVSRPTWTPDQIGRLTIVQAQFLLTGKVHQSAKTFKSAQEALAYLNSKKEGA